MKKLFLLLMLSLLLSPLYLSADIYTGIEAYYRFEWSNHDWTGNHNGASTNSMSYTYGLAGSSGKFNGTSSYMELDNFNPYDTGDNNAATISFWVKPEYDSSNHCYIGKHDTPNNDNIILFGYWSGKLHLRIKNSTVDISTDPEVTNEWTHYALAMWDDNGVATFVTVYRNGEEIFYGSLNDSLDDMGEKPWVVGMEWDSSGPSDHFKGEIDELIFYNTFLSETDVRDLTTMHSISNNLTAHYKLDNDVVDWNPSWGSFVGTAHDIDWKLGHEGQAAYFEDDPDAIPHIDNYIELGSAFTDPRSGGDSWSVSMWVKPEENNNHTYLAKNNDTGGNIFFFGVWSGGLQINFYGNMPFYFSEFNDSEEIDVWSHYVLNFLEPSIYPGWTRITVFKDGVKRGERWLNTVLPSNLFTIDNKPWLLGMEYDGSTKSDFFRGEIDHVRFYNKTLNAELVDELYKMDFGVRVCSGPNSLYDETCKTYNDTDFNLNENEDEWWVKESISTYPYYQWVLRRVNDDIESFHVYNGWETYVCQHANHGGNCLYVSGGEEGELITHSYLSIGANTISSLTVQPNSFHWARKLFPYGEPEDDDTTYTYSGYAYLYKHANYQGERLFLKDGDSIMDTSNTIVKDQTSSIELWGNITLDICKDISGGDCITVPTTLHNLNFTSPFTFAWTDFSEYNDNIERIYTESNMPSFGMFIADDTEMDWTDSTESYYATKTCLTGSSEIDGRIECYKKSFDMYTSENLSLTEFRDRIRDASNGGLESERRKFEKYADSYDILWLQGHGGVGYEYDAGDNEYYHQLAIGTSSDGVGSLTRLNNGPNSQLNRFSNIIGTVSADWFLTGACQSMGTRHGSEDLNDIYEEVLERAHGVGGIWANATWWKYPAGNHYYSNSRFWEKLSAFKPISEAWIETMFRDEIMVGSDRYGRIPEVLTRENCDCTNTSTCTSYMYNDFFGDLLPDKPDDLAGYDYLCWRSKQDNGGWIAYSAANSLPRESLEENLIMKIAETTAVELDDFIVAVGFDKESAEERISDDIRTKLQNKESALFFSSNRMRLEKKRKLVPFLSTEKSDVENETDRKEASELVEKLSSASVVLDSIVLDRTRSMIKDENGEYQDLSFIINRVKYIFKPLVDRKPVENAFAIVSFDQEGLYEVDVINFPKTVVEREGEIEITANRVAQKVGEHDKDGVYDVSVVEEEYRKEAVFYGVDENGLIRPVYMIEREKNLIETIQLD